MFKILTYKQFLFTLLLFFGGGTFIWAQSSLAVDIHLSDIVYSPLADKIYGVRASDGPDGNALIIINPVNGELEEFHNIHAEPYKIEFSPDYRYLHIIYLGADFLDRFDTQTNELQTIYHYTGSEIESTHASRREVLVLPNGDVIISPNLRVTFDEEPEISLEDVIISCEELVYHPETEMIYGVSSSNSSEIFCQYSVGEEGITLVSTDNLPISGSPGLRIWEDFLFFESGNVYNIGSGSPVFIKNLDEETGGNSSGSSIIAFDQDQEQVYFFRYRSIGVTTPGYYFNIFDANNLSFLESRYWEGQDLVDETGIPVKIVPTGAGGRFAMLLHETLPFNTYKIAPRNGSLVLIGNCEPPPTPQSFLIETSAPGACVGDTITFSTPMAYDYLVWSDGTSDLETKLSIGYVGSVEMFAVAYNTSGCLVAKSDTIEVFFDSPPEWVSISGEEFKCETDTISLTATAPDADYFLWDNGDTTLSTTVVDDGMHKIEAYTGHCSTPTIGQHYVQSYSTGIPQPTLSPTGEMMLCEGESIQLEASTSDNGFQLEWSHSGSSVNFPSVYSTGSYSVRYTDGFGCAGLWSDSLSLLFSPLPDAPDIGQQDSLFWLEVTAENRQWFRNFDIIPNAVDSTLIATSTGFYSARIKIAEEECWSPLSIPLFYEPFGTLPPEHVYGKVFGDWNNNQIQDEGDTPVSNIPFRITPPDYRVYSNEEGQFGYLLEPGIYDLNLLEVDFPFWEVGLGAEGYTIDLYSPTNEVFLFAITPSVDTTILEVNMDIGMTRCNTNVPFWVELSNTGTTAFTGQICLSWNLPLPEVIVGDSILDASLGTHCFEVEGLMPFQNQQWLLEMTMPNETATGQELIINSTTIDPEGEQLSYGGTLSSVILCSYDPNDKLVSPNWGEEGENYVRKSDTLKYTIRFQNTGNDTAFVIRLEDHLSDDLQWETFRPIGASHPYEILFEENTGRFEVFFDNILLPDSTTNFVGSQGFFSFMIQPNPTLEDFSEVFNTANIYFDFNAPIITNTVSSTVVSTFDADEDGFELWLDCDDTDPLINPDALEIPNNDEDEDCDGIILGVSELLSEIGLSIYPIPSDGLINFEFERIREAKINLYNGTGKLVGKFDLNGTKSVDLSHLAAGVYFVKISSLEKQVFTKIILL